MKGEGLEKRGTVVRGDKKEGRASRDCREKDVSLSLLTHRLQLVFITTNTGSVYK